MISFNKYLLFKLTYYVVLGHIKGNIPFLNHNGKVVEIATEITSKKVMQAVANSGMPFELIGGIQ